MSDFGFPVSWPIGEKDEISWEHMEQIRRRLYAMMFPFVGSVYGEEARQEMYDGHLDESTWDAFADTFDSDFITYGTLSKERLSSFDIIVYKDSTMSEPDLFAIRDITFQSVQDIKDNPPTNGDGTLRTSHWYWRVDEYRYSDLDPHSGRHIVVITNRVGKENYYAFEGWRILPKCVDPRKQSPRIKYTDTDREIWHRHPQLGKVETNYQHITQPLFLGPQYRVYRQFSGSPQYVYYWGKEDFAPSPTMLGEQFVWSIGTPPTEYNSELKNERHPPYELVANGIYGELNICAAIQNMLFCILETQHFFVPADGEYLYHFNLYRALLGSPPAEAADTGWAEMSHQWHGQNRSHLEYQLNKIETYDWFLNNDEDTAFNPYEVLQARAEAEGHLAEPSPEILRNIDEWVPLVAGNWHKTFVNTCGRPKSGLMLPGIVEPRLLDYADYQAEEEVVEPIGDPPEPNWWYNQIHIPSFFIMDEDTPADESTALAEATWPEETTEQEKADAYEGMLKRHDPVAVSPSDRPAFERVRLALNQIHDILELPVFRGFSGLSLTWRKRQKSGIDLGGDESNTEYQAARDAAIADDPAWTTDNVNHEATIGTQGLSSSIDFYGATFDIHELQLRITVNANALPQLPRGKRLLLHVRVMPRIMLENFEAADPLYSYDRRGFMEPVTIKIGDLELIVPVFDGTYFFNNRPSTGVPDTPPQLFYDWGGDLDTDVHHIVTGRMTAIPFDIESMTQLPSTTEWILPVEMVGLPVESVPQIIWPEDDWVFHTYSDCLVRAEGFSGAEHLVEDDPEIPSINLNAVRYRKFTEIAVDDGKFDDEGILKPENQWPE